MKKVVPTQSKRKSRVSLAPVRGVAFDIDDTFSTDGRITPEAYAALWALKRKGFKLVPITGRPAGWCDHIARFWPVDAVVGENGAFTFFMKDSKLQRLNTGAAPEATRARIEGLKRAVQTSFPEARWASDQAYREYDLAIDICEDVPPWSDAQVGALLALCKREGAHAKLSSVHVNAWFGNYTKRDGFAAWLDAQAPASMRSLEKWIFIGDSPNDEPMFEYFIHSAGVANLKRYLPKLCARPTLMMKGKSGAGFTELALTLLRR